MIWEKFYVEIQGGQVTPDAPSWGRLCTQAHKPHKLKQLKYI